MPETTSPEQRAKHATRRATLSVNVAVAIGVALRRIRLERGLKQHEMASILGISRPNYCRIERGNHEPSVTTLLLMADALGQNPLGLFGSIIDLVVAA